MFSPSARKTGGIPNPADFAATLKAQAARSQASGKPQSGDPRVPAPVPAKPSARIIRDVRLPTQLQMAAGNPPEIPGPNFQAYLDAMVLQFGARDVLEQTLVEQIVLAHLASFRLLAKAGLIGTADAEGIYASAAAKLMGEIRRTVVAIKELRSPPSPPNINVATTQQVNVIGSNAADVPADTAKKTSARSKVRSNDATGSDRMREILREDVGRAEEPAILGAVD